jgi:hypothetical protein
MMKYYGLSETPTALTDEIYHAMAMAYWGAMPLPNGAKLIGGYSDNNRAGALIELYNGRKICGNCGCITQVAI